MDTGDTFAQLVRLMHRLRAPGGCSWDAEQTHESLKPYFVEETYEALEAIDSGSDLELQEELGDVLLQVLFHSEIAGERRAFTINDVVESLSSKLIRRHPHVFADGDAETPEEVARNWARLKLEERKASAAAGQQPSVIDGVPAALPTLLKAHRLGEKAAGGGFDRASADDMRSQVDKGLTRLDAALTADDDQQSELVIGELLLSLVNLSRKIGVNADTALAGGLRLFEKRFRLFEKRFAGREVSDIAAGELENAWKKPDDQG
jgi:tetrapyrrole methylase family protein/MazG family protein